jgi:hypothetical protein
MTFIAAPNQPGGLVIVKFSANNLDVAFPNIPDEFDRRTARSIYNAWMETAIIDRFGMVWLLPDRLHEILRTSKPNARYITANIGKQYKSKGAAGTYLHYAEVNKRLNQIVMNAGTIKREGYAEFSESIGLAIRDSSKAKLQRAESYESLTAAKKQLKKGRLGLLQITRDELTGLPLLPTSQFSHIRSCAIYPQLATYIWNGLIVNRDIHKIVTDSYVNDENELYDLCRQKRWSTSWFDEYVAQFN